MNTKAFISFSDIEIQFYLDASDTNGAMTMFECRIAPGAKVPVPHYHEHFDETVFMLEGIGNFILGDQQLELHPGQAAFIPRGVVHGFINKTGNMMRFLSTATPGIFGPEYFQEIAAVLNAGGPPNMQALIAVMTRHGLKPVASQPTDN
jgi:quercetin dioxygenase-like cupin family protein